MPDPLGIIGTSGSLLGPTTPKGLGGAGQAGGPAFKDILLKNIEEVNKLQQEAERAIADLHANRRDDVANVMTAKVKADLAFKMLLQVRNKLMDAYEEIKQIRV